MTNSNIAAVRDAGLVAAFLYHRADTRCPARTAAGGGSPQRRRVVLRTPAWFEHLPCPNALDAFWGLAHED